MAKKHNDGGLERGQPAPSGPVAVPNNANPDAMRFAGFQDATPRVETANAPLGAARVQAPSNAASDAARAAGLEAGAVPLEEGEVEFLLLPGTGTARVDGRTYTAPATAEDPDTVIRTRQPLDRLFSNKVKRLTGRTKAAAHQDPTFHPRDLTTDRPVMADRPDRDRALGLPDPAAPGTPTRVEDVTTAPNPTLPDEASRRGFNPASEGEVEDLRAEGRNVSAIAGQQGGPDGGAPGAAESAEPLGEDVTERFPEAKKADLLVFRSGRQYLLADADEPGKALNKDEEITNMDGVRDFIKQYGE